MDSEILNSTAGVLMALAGLLAGLGALAKEIHLIVMWIWKKGFTPENADQESSNASDNKEERNMDKTSGASRVRQILGVLLIAGSCSILGLAAVEKNQQPLNVDLTQAAWQAFNKEDFTEAIAKAEKCITEFRGAAEREQAKLKDAKEPEPPTGAVSEAEKKKIMARGLLNDVATCFYIKGRSLESLGKKEEARQTYQETAKYTYGRCWDPKGGFWSPAETAQDRLATLK